MALYFIVSTLLIVIALFYIKIAEHYNIVDKPNFRSSHKEPVIRGAGILFYFAAIMFFLFCDFQFLFFILGLTLIAVVSYIDDLVTIGPKIRLVFQFIAITFVIYQLIILTGFPWLLLPLLLIIGVGFINIYNFMDGINGITGIYSLVAFLGLYFVNIKEDVLDERILIFVVISIIIFGFFNFRKKARFFCGDVGSISLAVILFFIISLFTIKLESPLFILLMGVYLTDSILTILYRKYLKENITKAHRRHIYQKLTDIKSFNHIKTSVFYSVIQGIIGLIVFLNYNQELNIQFKIFFVTVFLLILFYIILFKWLSYNE